VLPHDGPAGAGSASLEDAVSAGLEHVRGRIAAAGGDPDQVTVVAVTKGFGPDAPRAALRAGLDQLGENYAHELLDKASQVEGDGGSPPCWHFLGRIQRNKVARLAPVVGCWQSVSRAEEAVAIARRSPQPQVFIEVDLSGDPGRPGCDPAEAPAVVTAAVEVGCTVRGLMTVAPLASPGDTVGQDRMSRQAFESVARLAAELGLRELSMGMSADLEAAVEAGSTMVRIGTALFGERLVRYPHA
jgi:pyridoxal phosphate enzyme (YggS family)